MNIGDQTSVYLAAIAQGAQVMQYPTCIRVLGVFKEPYPILVSDADAQIAAVLVRLR